MGISGIFRPTLDVLWFSYFAKIEQKWHLPKRLYGLPCKKDDSLPEKSGDFGELGKVADTDLNQARFK